MIGRSKVTITELTLGGLKLIQPQVFKDERGFFIESYNQERYAEFGISEVFVQDNHSLSSQGSLRGMHFQSFPGQGKLIRVIQGTIFDAVVDIRPGSSTFGEWAGVELDAESHQQLWIPNGFAHVFCVLSETAEVLYKVTSLYNPTTEKGFAWNDPDIGIEWPVENPMLSDRDKSAPPFSEFKSSLS